ncbi:MAG: hypothetical protein IPP52_15475 [Ignavibacteria bacterium]|nr:hypothetical protein [Ignavibacteria bacterium]
MDKSTVKLYMIKENIICSKEEKGSIMRKFMEDTIMYKQELIDGVKVFIDKNSTVLCIPDKNRNIVHLDVESNTKTKAQQLMKDFRKKIESYVKIK